MSEDIRPQIDETQGTAAGPVTWYRVTLDDDLEESGEVTVTIQVPDGTSWRDSTEKLLNVRHGLPGGGTLESGTTCWVHRYFGRWCVIIPEC